ncbi:MAG: cupin domain-containing protein [Victivallales bacterium]|nr:cupin domain-containing protein [Victivallales bacterium]
MIKKNGEYQVDLRREMRGGNGEVIIEHLWAPQNELKSHTRMCARLTLKPGCSIGFHNHDGEEEIFYLVSGTAEADDNGVKVRLKAGDTMLTGGGNGHAIANNGNEDLVVMAMIANY